MNINGREIGPGNPVWLVAEAGSNHGGSLNTALRLVEVAAECGADAVKFQFFRANEMVAVGHPDFETFLHYEIPEFWLKPMRDHAAECGITLFYSVFSHEDVAVLESLDSPPAYKVASAELTYTALLDAVAATGKLVILSTGMSTARDVVRALTDLPKGTPFAMLHCVSAYPAPPEDMNLLAARIQTCDGSLWGLSDHTAEPFAAPLMAAALGASIIEKHFTLDRSQEGPDHAFAIEPDELRALAVALHDAHKLLGDGVKRVMPSERAALSDRRTLQNGKWLRGMPA